MPHPRRGPALGLRPAAAAAVGLAATAALLVWFATRPWAWSLVDDAGGRWDVVRRIDEQGVVGAAAGRLVANVQHDWVAGLFRPAFWVYFDLFYFLPIGAAHAVRLLFLLVAVGAPLLGAVAWLRSSRPRRWGLALGGWFACLLLANPGLPEQLIWMSTQELPGAALVAAGLLARRHGTRLVWWLLAAWMKAPYAWLLVVWGLILLWPWARRRLAGRPGERLDRAGLAGLLLGLATLATAYAFSRHGGYSSQAQPSLAGALDAASRLWRFVKWLLAIVVVGVPLLRLDPRALVPRDPVGGALYLGALLYAANLVAFGGGPSGAGYYYTAVVYLLGVAVVWAVAHRPYPLLGRQPPGVVVLCVALVLPLVITAHVGWHNGWRQANRNEMVLDMTDWLLALPDNHLVIGVNGSEAAARLTQDVWLQQGDDDWTNHVVYVPNGERIDQHLDYYVKFWDGGYGTNFYKQQRVRTMQWAEAYRVTHN